MACTPAAIYHACKLEGDEAANYWFGMQIRVYSLSEALSGTGARPGPIAAHRLSAKLSSLAWSPALPGVVTVGDYDGCVVQACPTRSFVPSCVRTCFTSRVCDVFASEDLHDGQG